MFRSVLWIALLFTQVNAMGALRPSFSLFARHLLQRFPFPEHDLSSSRELQKWSFGEGRVIFSTVSIGSAPLAEVGHELSISGPVSPFAQGDQDYDWWGSFRSISYAHTDTRKTISVSVRHGVWFHFYRNPGYFSERGPSSYRDLKHQLRIAADIQLMRGHLTFHFPVYLQQARYADFRTDARWNNRWRYGAWVSPELIYQTSDRWALSAFYETDTFVGSDLKRWYFWDSIADGEVGVRLSCTL